MCSFIVLLLKKSSEFKGSFRIQWTSFSRVVFGPLGVMQSLSEVKAITSVGD